MAEGHRAQNVELLNGKNYTSWRFKATVYLKTNGLWYTIEKDPPIAEEEKIIWDKHDGEAMNYLVQTLSSIQTQYVLNQKTAKEVWTKLEEVHRGNMKESIFTIKKELNATKWKIDDTAEKYMERVQGLLEQLRVTGENMDEAEAAAIAVQGLPKRFSKIATSFDMSPMENMTMAKLKYALTKEEERSQYEHVEFETANQSKTSSRNRGYFWRGRANSLENRGSHRGYQCFRCNLTGHIARHCTVPLTNTRGNTFRGRRGYRGNRGQSSRPFGGYREQHNNEHRVHAAQESDQTEFAIHVNDRPIKQNLPSDIRSKYQTTWIIDSAATSHMTGRRNPFLTLSNQENKPVELADGSVTYATGIGDIVMEVESGMTVNKLKVQNVLYVPNLRDNLLSVRKLTQNGFIVLFEENRCKVTCPITGTLLFETACKDGLYRVYVHEKEINEKVNKTEQNMDLLWHSRLAHASYDTVKNMSENNTVRDLNVKLINEEICEACIKGKQTRRSFKQTGTKQSSTILELIHTDLCGPIQEPSLGGSRYMLTLIDDFSRKVFVYFIETKSETGKCIIDFITNQERNTGLLVKRIRSDNGGEYLATHLKDYLMRKGIQHELTIPNTPQQNGLAERTNRTIMDATRSMLIDSKLPNSFWAEAANTAVYVRNRCPRKILNNKSPEEIWTKRIPTVSYFKVFGCVSYSWIHKSQRRKLDARSKVGIFVGYCMNRKGYKIYDPENNIFYASTDVKFSEERKGGELLQNDFTENPQQLWEPNIVQYPTNNTELLEGENRRDNPRIEMENEEQNEQREENERHPLRRSNRNRKIPERLQVIPKAKTYKSYTIGIKSEKEPETYEEIESRPDKREWEKSMQEELMAHEKMKTWTLIRREEGQKILKSKWVYALKRNPHTQEVKKKSRLVAMGNLQRKGLDYDQVYSPVMKLKSLRTVLSIANKEGLYLRQLDIKTAYLHGYLNENLYMEIPQGLSLTKEQEKVDLVCKLNKAIYGLHQSGKVWNETIDSKLKSFQYERCETDKCVYIKREGSDYVILMIYVDDMLMASNSNTLMNRCIEQLRQELHITDLGEPDTLLGIRIKRDLERRTLTIDQQELIEKILTDYNMDNCKPVKSPMIEGLHLKKPDQTSLDDSYQSIIGSLMYLVQGTRPDLAYSTHYLSQFNNTHGEEHLKALKRILRYLQETKNYALTYENKGTTMEGFSDASWNADNNDGKSTSGYIFTLCGTAISWNSCKQPLVALSSCEAEYMALTEAVKEGKWLEMFIREIGFEELLPETLTIGTDNLAAKQIAENPVRHQRTKHIALKYYFIRDEITKGQLKVIYVPSENMKADSLTKAVGPTKLLKELKGYGLLQKN